MSEAHMCDTKEIFHRSYNPLWFRLSRIEEIEDFFVIKIIDRKYKQDTQ